MGQIIEGLFEKYKKLLRPLLVEFKCRNMYGIFWKQTRIYSRREVASNWINQCISLNKNFN